MPRTTQTPMQCKSYEYLAGIIMIVNDARNALQSLHDWSQMLRIQRLLQTIMKCTNINFNVMPLESDDRMCTIQHQLQYNQDYYATRAQVFGLDWRLYLGFAVYISANVDL